MYIYILEKESSVVYDRNNVIVHFVKLKSILFSICMIDSRLIDFLSKSSYSLINDNMF